MADGSTPSDQSQESPVEMGSRASCVPGIGQEDPEVFVADTRGVEAGQARTAEGNPHHSGRQAAGGDDLAR